jgi:hypothetical protein
MPMSAAAATEAIVRYDMRVPFLDFLSPDMFRSEATDTRMGSVQLKLSLRPLSVWNLSKIAHTRRFRALRNVF